MVWITSLTCAAQKHGNVRCQEMANLFLPHTEGRKPEVDVSELDDAFTLL